MKLCSYIDPKGMGKVGALASSGRVAELKGYAGMKDLISRFEIEKGAISAQAAKAEKPYSLEEIVLAAPVPDAGKLIFIGVNYHDHIVETNSPMPTCPVIFSKFANSLTGCGATVVMPKAAEKVDYEAELAVVVGRTAKDVDVEDAMAYVFGYTACNDVSARDLQGQTSQWFRGKAIDSFAPMGPVVVTADEIPDPHTLGISCRFNGEVRQKSNTKELIFKVPYLISYISRTVTLEPGDIISTGTPGGVIGGMKNPVWVKDGDVCEVEIEKIGVLRNRFSR